METLHDFVVRQLLLAERRRWPEIAEISGVKLSTLKKIARRETADPGVSHIEKLAAYFRNRAAA